MKKQMLVALAAGLMTAAATPAIAQQGGSSVTTATAQGPILSFGVTKEVRSRPDEATIGAGVTTTAPTAVEAMRLNAAAMDKLIAAAKARGIKAEDIQTSGINLSPQYDYSERVPGQQPREVCAKSGTCAGHEGHLASQLLVHRRNLSSGPPSFEWPCARW